MRIIPFFLYNLLFIYLDFWNLLTRLSILDSFMIFPLRTSLVISSYIGKPAKEFFSKFIQTLPRDVISLLIYPKYVGVIFANSVIW